MRILLDTRSVSDKTPGTELYCRNLLEAFLPLLRNDEEVIIVAPHRVILPAIGGKKHFRIVKAAYTHNSLRGYFEIGRLAAEIQPDIFWTPTPLTTMRISTNRLLTLQDYHPLLQHNWGTYLQRFLWRCFAGYHIRQAHKIICATDSIKEACITRFGRQLERTTVTVYNGVSSHYCPQSAERIDSLRRKYSLPQKFLLFLGNGKPHKNLTTLLQTLAGMDETSCLPLIVAGYDSIRREYKEEVERLKLDYRVRFIGAVSEEELPVLYSAAHVFVLPSLIEGFCQPLLQAMACGTPVVCSAIPSLRELGGDAVLRVHPTDVIEWRKGLTLAILSSAWQENHRAKSLKQAQRFSWQATARETIEVCRTMTFSQ